MSVSNNFESSTKKIQFEQDHTRTGTQISAHAFRRESVEMGMQRSEESHHDDFNETPASLTRIKANQPEGATIPEDMKEDEISLNPLLQEN